MTVKKTTETVEETGQEQSPAVSEQQVDLQAAYKQLLDMQDLIRAQAKAQGVVLEEPPTEIVAYRDDREVKPGALEPGSENWRPWRKEDLDKNPEEKYDFVPQFIPGLVHPLLDKDRSAKIILDVNGLKCCLTVGKLNRNVSGMFYHAYKNAEDAWEKMEAFKVTGPEAGPHINGGPGGINTWHYEPEAPSAWIDLDGSYYKPGAPMPGVGEEE